MTDLHDNTDYIRRFEMAWQQGQTPEIASYMEGKAGESATAVNPDSLLEELICIDLEFRWKTMGVEVPKSIEDYAAEFPVLGSVNSLPVTLIAEEYRVRHRWGDRPAHEEYAHRFQPQQNQLLEALRQVDDELTVESNIDADRFVHTNQEFFQEADPAAPLQYSDYLLQKQLGEGGTGKVYLALQKSLDRSVVVKYLRKSFSRQPHAVARFVDEARKAARLNHRGIVTIHGLGRTPNGGYFIVMDHAAKGDLQSQIEAGGVSIRQAIAWTAEAAAAIQHAHDHGIVHCDLKPSNVLLDGDYRACVSDFGLALSLATNSTHIVEVAGTAPFMAPEQVADCWGQISERTDVYGLGGVLYALLTSRPPHSGKRVRDVLANVISARPIPSPYKMRPDIPKRLNDICQICLAKEPTKRFATALDFRAAMLEVELQSDTGI